MQECILANAYRLPMIGYGVYQIPKEETYECVREALSLGYRLLDTAAAYGNEEEVGKAIKDSGLKREEIYLVTKIWVEDFGYELTSKALDLALQKLDTPYIDLVILHQQFNDYYGAYRALEAYYKAGKLKAIGVSNFYPDRLLDLYLNSEIKPMVNQIECHPFYQRNKDLALMKELNIQAMAWGPLAEGGHNIFNHPLLKEIGMKYHKTAAQVALRFNYQRGVIVIPKSTHSDRMKENIDIEDFELSKEDMDRISLLDTGKTEIIDHYDLEVVRFLNNHHIH